MVSRGKRGHLLMVYGTLKRPFGNNRLLVTHNASFIGECVTRDPWFWMAGTGIPFLYLAPRDQRKDNDMLSKAKGELWRVDDAGLAACDRLEGHPNWYKREKVLVEIDGRKAKAWVYIMQTRRGEAPRNYERQPPDENNIVEWQPEVCQRYREIMEARRKAKAGAS